MQDFPETYEAMAIVLLQIILRIERRNSPMTRDQVFDLFRECRKAVRGRCAQRETMTEAAMH